jgi:hypothetical protein
MVFLIIASSARFAYSVLDYLLMLSVFHTRQHQMTSLLKDIEGIYG